MQLKAIAWGAAVTVPIVLSQQQCECLSLWTQAGPQEAVARHLRRRHVLLELGHNPHRTACGVQVRARFPALVRDARAAG